MNRRDFLKLVGLGTAGTVVTNACTTAEGSKDKLVSPVALSDEQTTGTSIWYASVCQQCPSGCGIIVRVMEGRAKKIEGNPIHPINQGKLCARGQAALQMLYNPDRVRQPLKISRERGSGQFVPMTWEEGIASTAQRLSDIQSSGSQGNFLLLAGSLRGSQALVVDRFARAFGASGYTAHELFGLDQYYNASKLAYGIETLPDYDLDNANYVLSFGANLFETWISPVRFGRGFGNMRQGRSGRRGKMVQVEPRMSLTAARADEWIPVKPGTLGLLALGIANVIISEGLTAGTSRQLATGWLDAAAYAPERIAPITGVSEEQIRRIAREFAAAQPGVAIGGDSAAGQTNGADSLLAINALNVLVGSVDVPGGVRLTQGLALTDVPPRKRTSAAELRTAIDSLNAGQIGTVLIYDANPIFTSPAQLGLSEALKKADFVVALSSFIDETSALADLILPINTFLESWGDDVPEYGAGNAVYSTLQPVVTPQYETRVAVDVLLDLAEKVGGNARLSLPWKSAQDVVRSQALQLQKLDRGSIREADADVFWAQLLQKGGWWDAGGPAVAVAPATTSPVRVEEPRFAGDPSTYPFHLNVYESMALSDGRGANLPWLQELPDPLSTAVWGSGVEINPATAEMLELEEGAAVWVESPAGKILAPVVLSPGAMPDVVSIAIGQGHTTYGRYASGRGANPLEILAPISDDSISSLANGATRVRIVKASTPVKLVKIHKVTERMEGKAFFE